jgi:hypothetical protein
VSVPWCGGVFFICFFSHFSSSFFVFVVLPHKSSNRSINVTLVEEWAVTTLMSRLMPSSLTSPTAADTQSGNQAISSLPLPPSLLSALHSGGFIDTADLVDSTPRELSRELNISMESALMILTQAKATAINTTGTGPGSSACAAVSGTELIKALPTNRLTATDTQPTPPSLAMNIPMNLPIITFCRGVDTLLGGGVPSGQITELCGVPGIGTHIHCIALHCIAFHCIALHCIALQTLLHHTSLTGCYIYMCRP